MLIWNWFKYKVLKLKPKLEEVSEAKVVSIENGTKKVKIRDYCEFCKKKITPSAKNICKFCRKNFCEDHWNAYCHNCKKREAGHPGGPRHTPVSLRYSK